MSRGRKRRRHEQRRRVERDAPERAVPSAKPYKITVEAPGQPPTEIHASHVEVTVDRDMAEATVFGDASKTYLVGMREWTIKAR